MKIRLALCCSMAPLASAAASAQVTPEQLLSPDTQPANWLSYSRDYSNQRHSPLDQINASNAGNLKLQVGVASAFARKVRSDAAGGERRALHGAGTE